MPLATIPAVDANICSGWNEQETNLWNSVDYFLAKLAVEKRKTYATHSKLIGKIPWKANQGPIMRGVRKEPSPHLRQFAFPTVMGSMPKKDVIDIRELTAEAQVSRHRFESQIMTFLPDFRDFMTDHVQAHGEDIEEKKIRYEDLFVRGSIYGRSPFVFLPNRAVDANGVAELVAAPMEQMNIAGTAENSKNTAWHQALLAQIGQPGNLSLNALNLLVTIAETDMRIQPFKGSGGQPGDNGPLSDMYCLVCSGEAWNQFIYDPFLLANKNCNLDVIKEGFRGNLFGRITTKLEDMPIRIAADGTFPQPEIREINPDAYNFGESLPNPAYTRCPFEVAFLYGRNDSYKSITVGPPPKAFAGNGMPNGFGKMFWNGEVMATKNLLIPCLDESTNTIVYEANNYGEYLKFISQITLGIIAQQPRNVIPIPFRRRRGQA